MSRSSRPPKSPIGPLARSASTQNVAPAFDNSRRPGIARQYHSRRSSTASSIHTLSGIDGVLQPDSIEESTGNAISTLLQPPILRTGLVPHSSVPSSIRIPTPRDISPVTLTTIPHIDNAAFRSYLEQSSDLFELFQKSKETPDQRSRASSHVDQDAGDGLNLKMQRRLSADSSHTANNVEPGSPVLRRRSGSDANRRKPPTVAPLSTIPNVYFEEDFHLENARTFDIVSEKSEIARPLDANGAPVSPGVSGKKALAANAILQEKLSWYMDTVEIHLISSISTASTSFFAALGSLRSLHDEAAECVGKIKTLRTDLKNLDESMAVGGLEIVTKKRRRENVRKLTDAVEQLQYIAEYVASCEDKIENGSVDEALAGLADVERLIAGERPFVKLSTTSAQMTAPERLIDLRGINALDGAANNIGILRKRIGKAYEARFIETLLQDLRKHVDSVPSKTSFSRWEKASSRLRGQHVRTPSEFPTYLNVDEDFRAGLRVQLKGLAKADSIMAATTAYREAVLKEFKNLIRRHLPSSSDDDVESTTSIATHESRALSSQEKSAVLARNLRSLEPEDAIEMLKSIYSNVGEGLRRLGTQVKVVLDITSSLENPNPHNLRSPPRTPQLGSLDTRVKSPGTPPIFIQHDEIQQALDMSHLLGQAVDIAQAQITKVLKVRVEQTTRTDPPFFLKYFTLNKLFADECEAVSGRGGNALKNVVHEHIKTFISLQADAQRQKLVQKMDADDWSAKDFSEEHNQRLKRIMDASTSGNEEWTKLGSIFEEDQGTPKATQNGFSNAQAAPNGETTGKDKVKSAMIDDEKYILPESGMVVATGIESYMKLLAGIPNMSSEISSALLEYLKLFNSRSSQLILGAGATRSAGLKNITTKHLALSSQALSYVVALIPYVREFARRYLPPSSALMGDFDKVRRLFQEHQSGIHDKLVEIMTGRATAHVNSMRKIDWDDASASGNVNQYMETLIKETTTLHRVLARHLPEASIMMIMRPVLASYQDQWTKAFNSANIKTERGKERLVRDAEFFKTRISKIDGAAEIGEAVYKLANDKTVEIEQLGPQEQQSSTDSTTTESNQSSSS